MRFPQSQFNGLSALGLDINIRIDLHKASNVQLGVHSFFTISKLIFN